MIDIHSHILFGQDDGPSTLEESVAMVKMAEAAGTTDIVASPHCNPEFEFAESVVKGKIEQLQAAAGGSIQIHYGCDFHLTLENIDDALAHPGKYSIDQKGYLLVEFSDFLIPKSTGHIFQRMLANGLRPIVTHPERNPLLARRPAEIEEWVAMGCLMQVTAASLAGQFGREAKRTGDEMMERGMVHVLASDAHDCHYRTPALDGAYRQMTKQYGEETARTLLVETPMAILAGAPLPAGRIALRKKKWYQRL